MKCFLCLEILDQKVRYIIIDQQAKGLSFQRTGESAIHVGSSASGALAQMVRDLAQEHNVRFSRIFVTLNRRDTIIHQLNVSKVSKQDLEIIVPGEIEKLPAFAERPFEYVYKEYETPITTRNKVIFAALAADVLDNILTELKTTNIPCQALEIAPLNVVGLLNDEEYRNQVQALVVLADNNSYLIVFENKEIKYVYNTGMGLDALMPEKMDDRKCAAWAEELKRALKAYQLDSKVNVERAWIVWNQDRAPDLLTYLDTQLNWRLEPLNVLSKLTGQETTNSIYLLAAVPAIYHVHRIKPDYSLTHFLRKSQAEYVIHRMANMAVAAVITIAIILAGLSFHFYSVERQAIKDGQSVRDQIAQIEKDSPDLIRMRAMYTKTRSQLLFQATYVKLLNRISWSEALSVVASELPEELSLTSFKVSETGQAVFAGEAFRMESVSKLLRKIETSAILANGKFDYLNEQTINKKKLYRFGILASIKTGDSS